MTSANASKPTIGIKNPGVPIAQGAITHSTKVPNSNIEYAPVRDLDVAKIEDLQGVDSADPRNRTRLTLGGVVGTFSKSDYISSNNAVVPTILAGGDGDPGKSPEARADRALEPTLMTRIHAKQTSMHHTVEAATQLEIENLQNAVPDRILNACTQIFFSAPGAEDVLLTPVHPVFREFELKRIRVERQNADKAMPAIGILPAGGQNSQNSGVFNSLNTGVHHFCYHGFSSDSLFSLRTFLSKLGRNKSSASSFIAALLNPYPVPRKGLYQLHRLSSLPDTRENHVKIDAIAGEIDKHLATYLPQCFAKYQQIFDLNPDLRNHNLICDLPAELRMALITGAMFNDVRPSLKKAAVQYIVGRVERIGMDTETGEIPAMPKAVKERLEATIQIIGKA